MPREAEFSYATVGRSGKPTEDKDKISKVVVYLKSYTSRSANLIGKELEEVLIQKNEVDKKFDSIKEEVRPFITELFDTQDSAWTRVVDTAKIVMSLSKETTRQSFDKNKFLEKIAVAFPELTAKFDEIAKECISVSNVASKLDIELKESIADKLKSVFGKIKDKIIEVVNKVKSYLPGYDKKLDSWKKELEANIINENYIREANKWF